MRGAKQAGLGKVGGKVGVGEFVHLRRLLPARLTYEPGKATTRVPSVAYGLGVIKRPSGACSTLPRGRFVRGVCSSVARGLRHTRGLPITLYSVGARVGESPYISNATFQAWAASFTT